MSRRDSNSVRAGLRREDFVSRVAENLRGHVAQGGIVFDKQDGFSSGPEIECFLRDSGIAGLWNAR